MAQGTITINEQVAASIITIVTNACSALETDVTAGVTGAAAPLIELGFADTCVSKIKKQLESITTIERQMIASISTHIQEVSTNEDNLYNQLSGNNYSGSYGGGTSYSDTSQDENSELQDEDDGKKVNCEELCTLLDTLSDSAITNLLKLIYVYKDKDTNLIDLILDTSLSEELFVLLKKAFDKSFEIDNLTVEEMEKVQKILLNNIFSKEVDTSYYEDNSILSAKEYLIKVCTDNKINPSDLFFDDKYKDTLKLSLKNVYIGNVDDTLTDTQLTKFRTYLDSICLKNNITVEELIDNKLEILL